MSRLVLLAATLLLAAPLAAQPGADAVQALQQQILADPALAGRVESLRDNPQMRAVLADPEIVDALNRGDITALLANPKIQRLAEDPAVQDVTRGLGQPPAPAAP